MPAKRSGDTVPQRRDPVATRKKLLTAARLEFARHGFAGARVDEIAERAGVNKQLVYHYFGDKDALYLAVLEWVYDDIREQERKLNLEGLPPEKAIRKLIEASFDYLAATPRFHRAAERREPRRRPPRPRLDAAGGDAFAAGQACVSHILHEGVRAGRVPQGRSTRSISISRSPGLSYFFFSNTPTLSAIFGKDLSSRRGQRRARRRHVVDLVLQALRPCRPLINQTG